MPLSARALAPPIDAAPGRAPMPSQAAAAARMRFGEVPITESDRFPPPAAGACWIYLTLNAEIMLSLPENAALQQLVQLPRTRVSVDSQWLWWALRHKYPRQPLRKLSGSDLIFSLAAVCAAQGRRLLLLGGTPAANAAAVMRLRALHPALAVAGYAPSHYRADDSAAEWRALAAAHESVQAFRPDYVVLGLGAEKEQRLALALAPRLDGQVTGLLCFGGAIDIASGQLRRAPRWMQRCGLEALFRLVQRPRRLPRCLRVLGILPRLVQGRY